MAKGKPVELGHRSFPTQKAAIEYFRDLLARHAVGDELAGESADFRDVRAILERHPERDQKVGCGIDAFIVRLDDNANKMFWLRRTDGTETDFSFYSCVKGRGSSLRQEFAEAARFAVFPEMRSHKDLYFAQHSNAEGLAPCEETGVLMCIDDAHVDHHPIPFDQIVEDFLRSFFITPSRNILSSPADNQQTTTFVCEMTEHQFVEFHRQRASLLVVHKSVNLRRKRIS